MSMQPPKLPRKIFEWFAGNAFVDDLIGDLDELYPINVKSKSAFTAKWLYWKAILSLVFSYALRKRKQKAKFGMYSSSVFSFAMLQSYFKVAARSLYQHKYFSILNALGLAIGMSVSLLLIVMYSYISSYDNFHENIDRIYTVSSLRTEGIESYELSSAPVALADKLKSEFAGAQEVVRIRSTFADNAVLDRENIAVRGYYADANFFSVFTFPLISGHASSALNKPNSIVLTEKIAQKLFSSTDVLGKTISFQGLGEFEITGVMQDYPKNTHFRFDVLASYSSLPVQQLSNEETWTQFNNQYVYVLLNEQTSRTQLNAYLEQTAAKTFAQTTIKVLFDAKTPNEAVTSENRNAIGPQWETSGFIVFGVISLLILLPACFNYTNISIARALKRSKEIGLRKTLGGMKGQIFAQFVTETILITLVSLVGAFGILLLIRPEFQSMMVEASALDLSITPKIALWFLFFAVATGLVAGAFPALYFAGLNPIQALKSKAGNRAQGMWVRKGLTIFQFALSFCFILSLIVFGRQYHTVLNFDFGFQKENIVNVTLQHAKPELVKAEFAKLSGVRSVSMSSALPGLSGERAWVHTETDSLETSQLFVDENFLETFQFTLIGGKNFPAFSGEEHFVIVNEQFLINSKISVSEATNKMITIEGKDLIILGVVKNFTYAAPQLPIGNFIFRMNPKRYAFANVVVNASNPYNLFSAMEMKWKELADREPLEASFFESQLNESFNVYRLLLKMAGFLGLLAISISILGLLGMVVYTAETRLKEMSIRKVLGASATGITLLLSKDYLKLMAWAIGFGLILSIGIYEVVFTHIPDYNASLTWIDIVLGVLVLLVLSLLTITSQTYKTASANPADVLRAE
jgi:putative ABC transport system permease protein